MAKAFPFWKWKDDWLQRLFMLYGQELLNFKTTSNTYYESPWAKTLIYTMITTCIASFREPIAYILWINSHVFSFCYKTTPQTECLLSLAFKVFRWKTKPVFYEHINISVKLGPVELLIRAIMAASKPCHFSFPCFSSGAQHESYQQHLHKTCSLCLIFIAKIMMVIWNYRRKATVETELPILRKLL